MVPIKLAMKIILIFLSLFTLSVYQAEGQDKFIVVIDAGHGGKDPGATRGTYKEKNINLGVALALGKLIERNYTDVKVVYTRKTDVFIELNERAAIANRNKANLFISIHTNSTQAKQTSAEGADTYILGLTKSAENLAVAKRENSVVTMESDYKSKYEGFDPNSPESYIIYEFMSNKYMEQSLQFATFVQNDFKKVAKRNDRGVRQAGFLVLWRTAMPSVLIELGFINNPSESRYLISSAGQNALARSIYSGFKKYKQNFDKMQGKSITKYADDADEFDLEDNADIEIEAADNISGAKVNNAIETINNTKPKSIQKGKVEYRVQFLVSPQKLPVRSAQFKGLSPVEFYKEGSTYKYTYGSTYDQNEILRIQKQVRTKFKDAFVVRFKDGQRIK